jgi:Coenzyme PQQ synthesis protein D (PqqD)
MRLLDSIPFLRRRSQTDWREVLRALPVRNIRLDWSEDDAGMVALRIPQRQDRWVRFLNRIAAAPEHKQVVLDEIGSDVWRMCDGATPVEAIVRALMKKYKLSRREVELSLSLYLKQLAKRGYLGLALAPEPVESGAAPVRGRRKRKECKPSIPRPSA